MSNIQNFAIGLLLGDGSFQINHWKKKYLQYRVVLKLKNHSENLIMLQKIRNSFMLGRIRVDKNYVLWLLDHKREIREFLALIKDNPILNLSERNFVKIQKMEYALKYNMSYTEYYYLDSKEKEGHWLWPFSNEINNKNIVFDKSLNWGVCGLIEAEGCFCVRSNGNHSFSFGQKDDLYMLEVIKSVFNLKNKIYKRKNNFFVIEAYSKEAIIGIISFLDNYGLKGYKNTQFKDFKNSFVTKFKVSC